MTKYFHKFIEPMPVMFYIFFIGIFIGVDNVIGLIFTFIGGFFGAFLLLEELKNK